MLNCYEEGHTPALVCRIYALMASLLPLNHVPVYYKFSSSVGSWVIMYSSDFPINKNVILSAKKSIFNVFRSSGQIMYVYYE